MSKTKATPRKKKAAAKKRTSPVDSKKESDVTLEREDLLLLKLAYSELQNKQLKLNDATRESEEAKVTWDKQADRINRKYGLTPGKDKINLGTGLIQKG